MNYILVDPPEIEKFYPFTLTRPFSELRLFGGTIKEIWEKYLGAEVSYFTKSHLSELYPLKFKRTNINREYGENIFIPSWYLPSPKAQPFKDYFRHPIEPFFKPMLSMDEERLKLDDFEGFSRSMFNRLDSVHKDICGGNDPQFLKPNILTTDSESMMRFSDFTESNINCSNSPFLNDDDGPIIVEKDVTIMEGAMIRGPVHICKGSTIKMGAKIYGPTVIGPYCKIGGEVSNCIFLGYSNKAHEGFLGHSIIGEWCNIGAGTSNSNLKNDYGTVKRWDYSERQFIDYGEQFLGLYMGDHSKCAINTSFNTGTTVGVNCNIFGSGFPRNFIPSFSWGGAQGFKAYDLEKAISVAERVMNRRGVKLTKEYIKMFRSVHDITSKMK